MTEWARPRSWRWVAALVMGTYAAGIALAPTRAAALALAAPLAIVPIAYWLVVERDHWLPLFFAAALLLPPLPFGLGDSGPHPSLVFVMAGLLAGMFRLREWRISDAGLNRALGIFFLILLGSAGLAVFYSGPKVGAGSLTRVLLFGISAYVFFYTAHGPGARQGASAYADVRRLYWIAVGSALFACADFYLQLPPPAGYGAQFVWLRSGVFRRAQGLFYEASTLGNFCAFFLTMIVAALLGRRDEAPVSRRALLAGGGIFLTALVLSYSRGSLLNLLVAAGVLLWMHRSRVRLGRFFLTLGCAVATAAVAVRAILPTFTGAYWMRLTTSVQYFSTETEGLLSGRLQSWRAVLEFLALHPWYGMFGVGYKTLPYSTYLGRTLIVDNMYLSLLAETGLLGLVAMLWLCVEILRAGWRAAHSPDARQRLFGSWIFAFWVGEMVQMFTGDLLTYWRVLPVYFWLLGLACARGGGGQGAGVGV